MDPSLETNLSYTPFVETLSHIRGKRAQLLSFVNHVSIYGNNILPDEMDARLLAQIPHRTVGKFSSEIPNNCVCSFYKKITQETAHFATFPEALVEPCIKAGTSERGCCSVCGAPWVRVVDRIGGPQGDHRKKLSENDNFKYGSGSGGGCDGIVRGGLLSKVYKDSGYPEYRTIGWQPSCTCNAEIVPCVVLDPFGGSGTVAKVARDLNRDAILIELNPAYVEIARRKLRANEQLFENVKVITA